jgi:hypothetical protein
MRVGRLVAGGVALALLLTPIACTKKSNSASGFCDVVEEQYEVVESAGASDEFDEEQVADAIDQLQNAAPDEISDDFEVIAEGMDVMLSNTTDPEAMMSAMSDLDLEALQEAGENIDTYISENCDVEMSS